MSPGQTNSQSVSCPECGTSFVEYLKDAETGDIVRPEDRRLFVCMICRHIFPVFADESPSIMRDAIGTAIEGDRKCPSCGYNLRTLKIGGRCPECAWRIRPEVTWTRPESEGSWTLWDTSRAIIGGIGLLAILVVGGSSRLNPYVFWGLAGLLFIVSGCGGLSTGRVSIISRSIYSRTCTGRWSQVISIVYILLGLAMGILALAYYLHWI